MKPVARVLPRATRMNRTEARYAVILEVRRRAGEVAEYHFEAVTLKIADDTRYTPDFLVVLADGQCELHEVKGGYVWEDARLKFQVAVEEWGHLFGFVWAQWSGGEWSMRRYPRRSPPSGAAER